MSERWSAVMRQAIDLAAKGRYGASPNPMVGAVVLSRSGQVVGEGAHLLCGTSHAEVIALDIAGEQAVGGTLVVTLEPCAHHGRTPPCTQRIIEAGISRVIVGTQDPNPLVNGQGLAALKSAGIEVIECVEGEACRALNKRFFHWMTSGLPFVTLKMAMTIDGKLAARGGRSKWITSEASRNEGYAIREEHDALLVGIGTVLADDPWLKRHLGLNPDPHLTRVVLDSRLRTPPTAKLLQYEPGDILVFCCENADQQRGQELIDMGAMVVEVGEDERGRCDLRQVLRWLGSHGTSSVLVEGGGEMHWSFLNEGLAQELVAFIAPLVLGGRDAISAVAGVGFASPQEGVHLRFTEVRRLAEDIVVIAEVGRV